MQVCVTHHLGDDGAGALLTTVGDLEDPPEPDTDATLLAAGHPTLTELTPLRPRPDVFERLGLGKRPTSVDRAVTRPGVGGLAPFLMLPRLGNRVGRGWPVRTGAESVRGDGE